MRRNAWCALGSAGALIALWCGSSQAADLPVIGWQGRTMGSPYTVKIVGTNLTPAQIDTLKAEVEERLKEVNRQMSHYQPDSELSRFNRAPAKTPFKVSPEFARVVRFSLEMYRRSNGAFDPTLAPVINLWGFGEKTDQRAVPPEAELKAAMKTTGCQHLSVTANDELVKDIPELTINLSAVAKGFGVDEMVRVLRGHGLTNIYASIAGEVRLTGPQPAGNELAGGHLGAPRTLEGRRPDGGRRVALRTRRSPLRATTRSSSPTRRAGACATSLIQRPAGQCNTTSAAFRWWPRTA